MAEKSILGELLRNVSGNILKKFALSIGNLLQGLKKSEFGAGSVSMNGLDVLCGRTPGDSSAAYSGKANIGIDRNSSMFNGLESIAVRGSRQSGYLLDTKNSDVVNKLYYRGGAGSYSATWLTDRETAKSSSL